MKRTRKLLATAIVASATVWAACGGVDPTGTISSVTVNPATATLSPGGSLQLTATARDAGGNALTAEFIWSSSSSAVATVDANGLVTAVAEGDAAIVALAEGGAAHADVTVTR